MATDSKRVPLANNTTLKIDDTEIIIRRHIGSGGSCLVYEGLWNNRPVIVKEFYPASMNLKRNTDNSLIISAEQSQLFEETEKSFEAGQSLHATCYGKSKHIRSYSMPVNFKYGYCNNTSYAVSYPGAGSVMTEIERRSLSLCRIAKIIISVCNAVSTFHDMGCLYMDIKPDNFFYLHRDDSEQIYACDFDTVIRLDKIRQHRYSFCSYSQGWSAPEQLPDAYGNGYAEPLNIGFHTDIYSIGAVFFWLLTGKTPDIETDVSAIKNKTYDWRKNCTFLENISGEAVEKINTICTKVIEPDAELRKSSFPDKSSVKALMAEFKDILRYSEGKSSDNDPQFNHIVNVEKSIDTCRTELKEAFASLNAQLAHSPEGAHSGDTEDQKRVKAISAYSQVFISIDKLFLRPELTPLKPFFYERCTELPSPDYMDLGLALSLRIRDGIQYSSAFLDFIPNTHRESHYEYQKQIMNAAITKEALKCYRFEWERDYKPVIDESKISVDSIVAYSKYWTDIGEIFLDKQKAGLRKYFFEAADTLPETRTAFDEAKVIAEIYRDAMMYSELLLDSIPYEFRRSYNVFKRNIMNSKIMQASMNDYVFHYEKEQGYETH